MGEPVVKTHTKYNFVRDSLHSGRPLIYGYSGIAKLNYVIYNKRIKRRIGIGIYDDRSPDLFIEEEKFKGRVDEFVKLIKINKDEIQNCVLFIPNSTGFVKNLEKSIDREEIRNRAVKLGANVSVAKTISECIHEKFTEVIPETLSVRKEVPDGSVLYIKLSDLGDGVEKAIKVMLVLETLKPKLILWDDFEASAHPSLIKILLRWLSKKDWQIVISTHSIDVLYELVDMKDAENINSEDMTILLLEKMKDDILIYEKLSLDELEDLIIANQDPRIVANVLQLR